VFVVLVTPLLLLSLSPYQAHFFHFKGCVMDGAFLKPSFDVSSWINASLAGREDGQSVEENASGLVLTLQMRQIELSGQLEEASYEAAGSIPRLLRELERIRTESDALKSKLQQIEMSLGGIEASTERSVALLIELDRVKQNMLQCASALREAERFTALSKVKKTTFSNPKNWFSFTGLFG
jgi:hypothetical protein